MRIIHFAEWLMNTYEDLLDWAAELRAAIVPDEFQRAVELNAQAAGDRAVAELRRALGLT